ncbi:MAG: MFS transporter [Sphingobium sp.]|nr:MFS transporter [Sphingobium sp.]
MHSPSPASDSKMDSPSAPFSIKPLMFSVFVCSMAMMAFVAVAAPIARILGMAPWQIGATMTISGVAWLVMARIWGQKSDKYGRRPIILIGLGGFAITYFLLTLFIDGALRTGMASWLAFAGIMIGRCLTGFFYAAVPSANTALVADNVPPQQRAGALAAIGAANAAGMAIGPGIAGVIATISLSLPLYATAILPLIALTLLWRVLPRQQPLATPNKGDMRLFDLRLRRPMAMSFIAMFSVSVSQVVVGFYALDRLHLGPTEAASVAGIALACVGISLVISQAALSKLNKSPETMIRYGAIIGGAGYLLTAIATTPPLLWVCYAVMAFGMGWVFPSVSAIAANSVERHEQGVAAGTVGAAQGLGIVIGPIFGTAVYTIEMSLPYLLIGLLLVVSGLYMARTNRRHEGKGLSEPR